MQLVLLGGSGSQPVTDVACERKVQGEHFRVHLNFNWLPLRRISFVLLPLCLVECVQLKCTRKELIRAPSGTWLLSHRIWRE